MDYQPAAIIRAAMFCRSLLLVLLGLSCLQSFTMAEYAHGAGLCCFEFHKSPVPAAIVATVEKTRFECPLPGVILTTKKGYQICADPEVDWVKEIKIKAPTLS
ncbi:C-C motif chemokine 18-like isoform X4 [Silurus meridionalis]|uniref:C-C motif chemokine 18-like isoform X4 n=1 Tax=Silurus meridionalis TaxID=175797 RepID=UPI001EEC886B|nr:C-C motif chemokine 18-like isoform X4 [Silurus meridionalis]